MTLWEAAEKTGTRLWGQFAALAIAIDAGGSESVLIRSCNGAGKTRFLALIAAWEMYEAQRQQVPTKVLLTSATATQLRNALWAETKKCTKALGCMLDYTAMLMTGSSATCIGVNPAKIESGQGYHADRVVVLIDEASNFSADMLNALFSNVTGGSGRKVITFNPMDTDTQMYAIEEANNDWIKYKISAFEHPNVIDGEEIIKGAVTRAFVEAQLHNTSVQCDNLFPGAIKVPWNDTWWQPTAGAMARVCGEWTLAVSHGFIPMPEILACCQAEVSQGMRIAGVDIAGNGADRNMISIFYGDEQICYQSIEGTDHATTAMWVRRVCEEHAIEVVCIDDTGIGNAVTERLADTLQSTILIPVHFSQSPKGFAKLQKPANARAEMYMCLEKEIRQRTVKLLYDQQGLKEIGAARMVPMKTDKVRLEDKTMIKRRLGRSPDKADATALARYARHLLKLHSQPRLF